MADSSNFLSSRVVSIITAWLDKHADSHIPSRIGQKVLSVSLDSFLPILRKKD